MQRELPRAVTIFSRYMSCCFNKLLTDSAEEFQAVFQRPKFVMIYMPSKCFICFHHVCPSMFILQEAHPRRGLYRYEDRRRQGPPACMLIWDTCSTILRVHLFRWPSITVISYMCRHSRNAPEISRRLRLFQPA